MPSPFPGMDPYLEGAVWESLHGLLAAEIARSLAPRLLPRYIVRPEKIYVMSMTDTIGAAGPPATRRRPDVSVAVGDPEAALPEGGNVAVLEAPLQVDVAMPEVEPDPQLSVEIRDPLDQSLVTAIEVLSTSNKRGDGRDQYLVKRDRILLSESHLVEIDLVRTGERLPMAGVLPDVPYVIVRSRADRRPRADVWPVTFRDRLPTIPVPLRGDDPDVPLDLQAILDTLYDLFGLNVGLNYGRPPAVPLSPVDAAWAADLLARRRS